MVSKTPDWPYWWAIADTRVKLSQCVALSLNIDPNSISLRPHYLGRTGFPVFMNSNSVKAFRTRLKILAAYRRNGECFSADLPGSDERTLSLREFAAWALRNFTESQIPNELAVLGVIGDDP